MICINILKKKAVDRLYWDNFIQDFFTDQSTMKMGLFNMETNEQKSFGKSTERGVGMRGRETYLF